MKTLLILGMSLAGVLLFLLATASANTSLFAEHYSVLLGLNAILAAALLALVGYQLASLRRRLKQKVFGSRLTLRFLVLFAAIAVVPGVLVYTVSVQFLSKSIESWFDVSVDSALEGGIKLGQAAVDQMLAELNVKAKAMALELADRSDSQQIVALNRLRQQAGVEDAVVVAASGRLVASGSDNLSQLVPELPSALQLRKARNNRGLTSIDALPGKPLGLRAIVPIAGSMISDETRYLQLRHPVPEALARSAESVEAVYGDYKKLALSRQGLKRSYIVTLTLALLMALFSAVALAFILSDRMSAPLSELAQATQAVARGDFSRRMPVTSRDELGVLLESFNSMTRQLDEARQGVESNRLQLETAKARLENILSNLSAGVLVFDPELRLSIFNHGAAAILGGELGALNGKALGEWGGFESFAGPVGQAFAAHGEKGWQLELVLSGTGKTLLARGTPLPSGYVLVFDDVTQLIQAQRATAWAEVARRLAHEIKNPLTPIQLSAERLEMKLADKLGPVDAETLKRGTQTIVNQVAALKSMPAPVPARLDLNALVSEVLSMYETSSIPIRGELAGGVPQVFADSAQIRQVLHNLVQNAQDALGATKSPDAAIEVRTELAGAWVRLVVSDNGSGFPEELMARIFEPYVTTKPRGTGLGLAIVKKIVDEHHGEIAIENRPHNGASVTIRLPVPDGDSASARAA
ncbi:MAG: ATP-binding protein [Proteobacteria bacterium]|nr:ATP-binding protein [Pseudomonadota bacterium]